MTAPELSLASAVKRAVSARAVTVRSAGETNRKRATWATTRVAVSAAPPTRAMILVVPEPVAVATPRLLTRATLVSVLLQRGLAPVVTRVVGARTNAR